MLIGTVFSLATMFDVAPLFAQPKDSGATIERKDLVERGVELFEDQQYEESIQTLSSALLRPNNTREQKIAIYRTLAFDFITLGRTEEAENAVRGLVAFEPAYKLSENESPRFRDFFAQIQRTLEEETRKAPPQGASPPPAIRLTHFPPPTSQEKKPIEFVVRADDPSHRIANVRLFFRSGSRNPFAEPRVAKFDADSARCSIPSSIVRPPFVEYYMEALDERGHVVTTDGTGSNPHRVPVSETRKSWVLPIAIGGGVLGAAAIVSGLAPAGVFESSAPGHPMTTVRVSIKQ